MKRVLLFLMLFAVPGFGATTKEIGTEVKNVVTTLTDAPTVTWDASTAFAFRLTLGGNRAISNPTNLSAGETFTLELAQDGTGSRVPTWGNKFRWTQNTAYAPPTFSTAPYAVDELLFTSDGTYATLLAVMLNVYGHDVAAPSSLTATTNQTGQITLGWTDNTSDEAGFIVEIDGGSTWVEIARTAANAQAYVDSGISGDVTYRVRAFRPGAVSDPSNSATGTAL
jgi:hypothetical protein